MPTVLPVLGRAVAPGGQSWLHVRLPGRPEQTRGLDPRLPDQAHVHRVAAVLDLSARRVTVYQYGRAAAGSRSVVGKPSTPTPTGQFFIEEALDISSQVGGPFALATSARSNVLQEFEGGPGQIALHGTNGSRACPARRGFPRLHPTRHGLHHVARATHVGRGVPLTISSNKQNISNPHWCANLRAPWQAIG